MRPRAFIPTVVLVALASWVRADDNALPESTGASSRLTFTTEHEARKANEAEPLCTLCKCEVSKVLQISKEVTEGCRIPMVVFEDRSTSFSQATNSVVTSQRAEQVKKLREVLKAGNRIKVDPPFVEETAGLKTRTTTYLSLTPQEIHYSTFPTECGCKKGDLKPAPADGPTGRNCFSPIARTLNGFQREPNIPASVPLIVVMISDGYEFDPQYSPAKPENGDFCDEITAPKLQGFCVQQKEHFNTAIKSFLEADQNRYLVFLQASPIDSDCDHQENKDGKFDGRPAFDSHANASVCGVDKTTRCMSHIFPDSDQDIAKGMGAQTKETIRSILERDLKLHAREIVAALRAANQCQTESVHETRSDEYTVERSLPDNRFDDAVVVGNDKTLHCTGVVVGKNAVLTAAHCLPATRISVGESARESGKVFLVSESVRHPLPQVDAALVKTNRPLDIQPKPWRGGRDTEAPLGALRFVGFGATDTRGRGRFGERKVLDLASDGWGCTGSRAARTGCVEAFEMVVPGMPSGDTCSGDSGGPLYEIFGDGSTCGFRLVGITSRRTDDSRVQCGNGGIYVRVDRISDWITTTVNGWL